MKKTREFHDNESENIRGESIRGAALMNFFVPDAELIRVNTVTSRLFRLGYVDTEISSLLLYKIFLENNSTNEGDYAVYLLVDQNRFS